MDEPRYITTDIIRKAESELKACEMTPIEAFQRVADDTMTNEQIKRVQEIVAAHPDRFRILEDGIIMLIREL